MGKTIKTVSVLVLGAFLALLIPPRCNPLNNSKTSPRRFRTDTVTVTDTIRDTVRDMRVQKVREQRLDTIRDTILRTKQDTSRALLSYFSSRSYRSEFSDSLLKGEIRTKISRNRLDSVSFNYSLLRETKKVTVQDPDQYQLNSALFIARGNVSPGLTLSRNRIKGGLFYNLLTGSPGALVSVRIARF